MSILSNEIFFRFHRHFFGHVFVALQSWPRKLFLNQIFSPFNSRSFIWSFNVIPADAI